MKHLFLLLAGLSLAGTAWAQQAAIEPKSATAMGQDGRGVKMENPLAKLLETTPEGAVKVVPRLDLEGRTGVVIFDFEAGNGWPASVQQLQKSPHGEGWLAFTGPGLAPYQVEEALGPVKAGPTTVTFRAAVLGPDDAAPRPLDPAASGVFVVKSEDGIMLSGVQGLVAGPRAALRDADGGALGEGGKGLPVGFLVKFDPPVSAVGLSHFNGDLFVAVFGADGKRLGQIRNGTKPDDTYYYGFEGEPGSIHSVFVGNLFPEDGILDDLTFVP